MCLTPEQEDALLTTIADYCLESDMPVDPIKSVSLATRTPRPTARYRATPSHTILGQVHTALADVASPPPVAPNASWMTSVSGSARNGSQSTPS